MGHIALSGAEAAEKQLQGLEGFAKKNEKAFKAAGIAMTAAGAAITGALAFATKAALDEQIGINRLDVALKNAGQSYANLKGEIEASLAATQAKTNYDDGEQREALVALIGVTGTYQGALEQLRIATDLAAAKNMDLTSAATLVGRVTTGNTELLSRYGIQVKEGASATEILADMQTRFAGAAAGAANPLTQLKNTVADLAEDIGSALIPVLRSGVDYIKPVLVQVRDWIKANPELTKGIVVLGGTLSILMGTVIGPMFILIPKLVKDFIAFQKSILAVKLITVEYTIIALAAVVAMYAMLNLVRSIKSGLSGGEWATEGSIFDAIKRDVGSLISKIGELLPASNAAIEEATSQGKTAFDNLAAGIGGTTQKLEEFNTKAQETRDAERRLAMDFTALWQNLTYGETKAGQLNLTMEDVYTTLYKLGYGVEDIGKVFEKYQGRQDAVNQVLQEYGLTAEQVAKMVGKLREETDKQTESILRQADATNKAKQAALPGGLFMTPWGVIVAKGERALGPGAPGQQPEYIGGQGLTGKFYAQGGPIEEPTLLTRLRDMKPYAVAGESGPERVVAGRGGGVVITGNNFYVRKDSDIDKIAEAIVGKIRLQQGLRGI